MLATGASAVALAKAENPWDARQKIPQAPKGRQNSSDYMLEVDFLPALRGLEIYWAWGSTGCAYAPPVANISCPFRALDCLDTINSRI